MDLCNKGELMGLPNNILEREKEVAQSNIKDLTDYVELVDEEIMRRGL